MHGATSPASAASLSRRAFLGGVGGTAVALVATAVETGAPATASAASGYPNLVINPSFELSPAGGVPVGWTLSPAG